VKLEATSRRHEGLVLFSISRGGGFKISPARAWTKQPAAAMFAPSSQKAVDLRANPHRQSHQQDNQGAVKSHGPSTAKCWVTKTPVLPRRWIDGADDCHGNPARSLDRSRSFCGSTARASESQTFFDLNDNWRRDSMSAHHCRHLTMIP
jgi:hypothetical protein